MNRHLVSSEPATVHRALAALLIPGVAFVVQWLLWDWFISPLVWFLFYPAVFAASAYGGLLSGLGAVLVSSLFVSAAFFPSAWAGEPRQWLSLGGFVAMGVLVSEMHRRSKNARRELAAAIGAAERSREQLLAVVEAVQDGISVADMSGNIFLVNEAQARINGFPSREDMQRNIAQFAEFYELSEPDGRVVEPTRWPLARVLRGESISEWELVTRRTDIGRQWLISFSGGPVRDAQGRQELAVVVTRDLTDRKLTQVALERDRGELDALRVIERRKDEFLITLAEPVIIFGPAGLVEYANEQAHRVFGYRSGELLGMTLEGLVPERFRERHTRHVQAFRAAPTTRPMGGLAGSRLVALRKDGSEFPVEVSLGAIRRPEGFMVTTVLRDVTERVRVEESARLNADRLSDAVESIPDSFALWDAADRLVICNLAYRSLFPAAVQPRVGMSFDEVSKNEHGLASFDSEMARQSFMSERAAVRTEKTDSYDLCLQDGRTIRMTRRRTPEGGRVGLGFDLTGELERERDLERARADADEANRAKSDFLSSMSHELRTPLNSVLGFAQLLQRDKGGKLSERQHQMVDHIFKGGEHLLRLIDDILDLARIEAKGIEISREPVDVTATLNEVARALEPAAFSAGIELRLPSDSALPTVEADSGRFLQILMNFVSNAIKYNRAGGSVSVTVARAEPDAVRVSVSDTGVGVPLQHQDKIFQPFQRAGQETGAIEGTGVGLAICKRLAEAMGGSVGFGSVPDEGSTFWVELPIHASDTRPSNRPVRLTAVSTGWVAGEDALVLYIEDNPTNVLLLQDMLGERERVELIFAATAEEGLTLASQRRPKVILLDIHLPDMSGFSVLELLKGSPDTRDIPVIAVTAAASAADRERGRLAGFAHYLTKPLVLDELEQVLSAIITPAVYERLADSRAGS